MTPEQYDKIANSLQAVQVGMELNNAPLVEIKDHLARLNGKVAAQEVNINTLLIWKARFEGASGAVKIMSVAGWGIVLAIISAIFYGIFQKI